MVVLEGGVMDQVFWKIDTPLLFALQVLAGMYSVVCM